MHNNGIFRTYDIRGEYGKDFDLEFAERLGRALVKYTRAKKVLVGQDDRESSNAIFGALSKGITEAGANIVNMGKISAPLFYFAGFRSRVEAGIMITASHLKHQYNGFKIHGKSFTPIVTGNGLEELKSLIVTNTFESSSKIGSILNDRRILNSYVGHVLKLAKIKKGKLKVKFGILESPSVIWQELDEVFKELDLKPIKEGYNVAFSFDSDGDRLYVHDRNGKEIEPDLIFGVLASGILKPSFFRKPKIVYDLTFSRKVVEYLKTRGVIGIKSKVRRVFVREAMNKHKADLGGEISGHIYFREMHNSEASVLAMLLVLKIMHNSGLSLEELLQPFREKWVSRKINWVVMKTTEQRKELFEELSRFYKDGQQDFLDGISVGYPDWSFNLRFATTEDLLRLSIGAETEALLNEKLTEIQKFITNG